MEEIDDLYYINKVKHGEINYYTHLVDKYKDRVFSIALKILRNREDAEEMAQETFVKAYKSIHSFRGDSKFSTWLFRITYNSSISEVRKKKQTISSLDEDRYQGETEEIELDGPVGERRAEYVKAALGKLDPEDYTLILLYYFDNQSVEEITRVTKLSESNVKVKLHRARKKLYSVLNELLHEEIHTLL
jgi:RNA polymerase sigma factor (sigma-70 family)